MASTARTPRPPAAARTPAGSNTRGTTTSEVGSAPLSDQAGRTGLGDGHSTAGVAVIAAARLPLDDLAEQVGGDPARTFHRRVVARAEIAEQRHQVLRATW